MFRPIPALSFLFVFFLFSHVTNAQPHPACPDDSYFTVMSDNGVRYGWYEDATCIFENPIALIHSICPDESYFTVQGENGVRYGWYEEATCIFENPTSLMHPICPDESYFTVQGENGVRYGWYEEATCIFENPTSLMHPICPDESYFIVQGDNGIRYGWFENATCIVDEDITPPVIILLGDNPLTLFENAIDFVDPGFVVEDDKEGDLTAFVIVGGDVVDTSSVAEYTVTYNVADSSGNNALEVTRLIIVRDAPIATEEIDIDVSPFPEDPNAITIRSAANGVTATLVGDRNVAGYLDQIDHIRIEGLQADGEVRTLSSNAFMFNGDDGSELVMQLNDAGDVIGVSFRENLTAETFSAGQLPATPDLKQFNAKVSNNRFAKVLGDGRPVQVSVTKCDGVPQPDQRFVSADFILSGLVGAHFSTDTLDGSWQQSGNVYTGRIPDYDNRWEANVADAAQLVLNGLNEGLKGVCKVASFLPVSLGGLYVVTNGSLVCLQASALLAASGISTLASPVLLAACESSVVALASTCPYLASPGATRALDSAVEVALGALELEGTLTVSVQPDGEFGFTAIESMPFTSPFGTSPVEFSLDGGPVDTVTTITSSPNPSDPGEPVAVRVDVKEASGEGCLVNGTLEIIEDLERVRLNTDFQTFDVYGTTFDESTESAVYTARYDGDEINFNDSSANPYTHIVNAKEVIEVMFSLPVVSVGWGGSAAACRPNTSI